MSDRSYVNIMFYDCPRDEWEAVCGILEKHGIRTGDLVGEPPTFPLDLTEEEVRLGSLHDACQEISKAHPKAIFWGQQDAYYEYYGDRCIQVEEGYSWRETDNSGNVPLTAERIMNIAHGCDPENLEYMLLEEVGHKYVVAATQWRDGLRKPQFVIDEAPSLI